jgi:hypothetical protein
MARCVGGITRQRLEIPVAGAILQPRQNTLQRYVGREAAISEAPDHEKWNGERATRRSAPGEETDCGAIDSFPHRLSARLDLVVSGRQRAPAQDSRSGELHSARLLVHRAFDIEGIDALGRELQCAILERLGGEPVIAGVGDACQDSRSDIRWKYFAEARGRIPRDDLRVRRDRRDQEGG